MVRWFGRKKPVSAPRSRRAKVWYWARRTLGLIAGSLLLLVFLLLIGLFVGPTRGLLLSAGVKVADSFLPGQLSVDRADWPRPGHLVFRDILWTTGASGAGRDTLADVALLDIGLDFAALRAREGRVDSVVLDVRNFDLPLLTDAFAKGDSTSLDTLAAPSPSDLPYLHPGSIPGLPSATLGALRVRTDRMRLAPGLIFHDLKLSARADIASGTQPWLAVESLSGRARGVVRDTSGERSWSADLRDLGAAASLDSASLGHLDFRKMTATLDSLKIEAGPVVLEDKIVADEIRLELTARVEEGQRVALVLGPVSARGHEGAGDSLRTFGLDLAHLGFGGSYVPDSVRPGDLSGLTATLDSLTLTAGPATLGSDLALDGIRLDVRGKILEGNQAAVTIGHLGAVLEGAVADSAGTRRFGLALEHLGMGARLLADPDGPDGWRLAKVDLDSLNLDLVPSGSAEVVAGWDPEEPLKLDTRGVLAREGEEYLADLDIDFALPGTSHLPALLPRDFPHEAFGALAGELHLDGSYGDERIVGDLVLDIAETAWLEAGHFELHLDADHQELAEGDLASVTFHADSLALGMYGAGFMLDGGVDRGDLDLHLELAVDNPELVRMFSAFAGKEDSLVVDADLRLSGTLDEPLVVGYVEGGADMAQIRVPQFRLDLDGDHHRVEADLSAGGGLAVQGGKLDSLVVHLAGVRDTTGLLSAGFSLQVWEKAIALGLGGYASLDSVRTMRLDSLQIAREDRSMTLRDPATLTLGPGEGRFLLTPLVIEGDAGELSLQGHWAPEDFDLDGLVDLVIDEDFLQLLAPSPVWSMEGGMDLTLDAVIDLSGTPDSPHFAGHSRTRLIPHRDHPNVGVDLDFKLATGDTAGLYATMNVMSADTNLVAGSAMWPGRADLSSGSWEPDPTRELDINIPLQGVPLTWLNRFMPDGVGVKGPLSIAADVGLKLGRKDTETSGDAEKDDGSRVEVELKSPGLEVSLPNRSRIEFDLDLATSGTLTDPLVKGRVEVESAFFRIPEIPRSMHPVEGPSLLWALRDSIAARLDSTAVLADSFKVFTTPDQGGPGLVTSGPAFMPHLDIDIVIPGNFRINGYGADLELEGDIHVGRGFDEDGFPGPSLGGEIGIRNGTLQFMNRVFKPDRGHIFFTGTTPPNPRLDILLEADVSGTIVRILITGMTNDPVIDLTSEPAMEQEDIMAVLLFGRPLNDLDNDQRGGVDDSSDPAKELRENLAGLAMVFGTQGISNQMSTAIGVDMMQMGADSSGGSTFMVGKFISPELMVKYHASLEHSGTYFMTLEYTLSRYFKLLTTYGQGEEASGAEIQWSKKY